MRRPKVVSSDKSRSQLLFVGNEKGGQGKSLTALAAADHAYLHDAPLRVAQIDTQLRLSQALGQVVLTVEPVARNIRRDPSAEAKSFTPLYALMEEASGSSASALIDAGANQSARFANWAGLVELSEDLDSWGFDTILLVPYVAEVEGIRQAGYTAALLLERMPKATLVLVENERDGAFEALHPASDAAQTYRTVIEPLQKQATTLKMPAIDAGSWRPFEASGCRLLDVAQMPVERVMHLTGLPRPEAKIVKGDVAGWTARFFSELDRVLPWKHVGVSNG